MTGGICRKKVVGRNAEVRRIDALALAQGFFQNEMEVTPKTSRSAVFKHVENSIYAALFAQIFSN